MQGIAKEFRELYKLRDKNENETVTIHSKGEEVVERKGRKARLLIHKYFKPKGGCANMRLSLWDAAELYDKTQCLPVLIIDLNKMPDSFPV